MVRRVHCGKQNNDILPLVEDCIDSANRDRGPYFEEEIEDSQLRMMFVCCHPGMAPEAQVALTLKVLCGFGEREIAAAFLASEAAIAKRPVRTSLAMTGEVTLRGRVLTIGGLKEKVLAAHRAGLKEVVLPVRNGPDLEDVPEEVREVMTFHLATTIADVLTLRDTLGPLPGLSLAYIGDANNMCRSLAKAALMEGMEFRVASPAAYSFSAEELAGLQAQHDLAMSAFQFDEASALQRRIGALDDERRPLAAALPEPTLPPEPITPGVRSRAPVRRGRRRRISPASRDWCRPR